MNESKEQWKRITNFPGYEVSDMGRVRSKKRGKMKLLKQHSNGKGYLQVSLRKDSKTHRKSVHHLVAQEFLLYYKTELWSEISGFPGYEVSIYGRVRCGETIMRDTNDWPEVSLKRHGVSTSRYAANLVFDEFGSIADPSSNEKKLKHLNNDLTDNRLVNLMLCKK